MQLLRKLHLECGTNPFGGICSQFLFIRMLKRLVSFFASKPPGLHPFFRTGLHQEEKTQFLVEYGLKSVRKKQFDRFIYLSLIVCLICHLLLKILFSSYIFFNIIFSQSMIENCFKNRLSFIILLYVTII